MFLNSLRRQSASSFALNLALSSKPLLIGFEYLFLKSFISPKMPSATKSNIEKNSSRLF